MNSRVTLTDVAKRAGVHYTTVSLALRNHPRLPKATRERLRELAEHMGYRPDPLLHALAEYRNSKKVRQGIATLAYLTNWSSRWGWKQVSSEAEFYLGAEERAAKLGYKLEHFWRGEPQMTDQRLTDVLSARGITGIIVASDDGENIVPALDWDKFSAVKIGVSPSLSPLHQITIDRASAIPLALHHVIAAGYKRVGVVLDRTCDEGSALLEAARSFERQVRDASVQLATYVFSKPVRPATTDSLYIDRQTRAFKSWMVDAAPEVLVSTTGLIRPMLDSMNLAAPLDIAFVDVMLENANGEVAGVKTNCRFAGETAVEALAAQMNQHLYGLPEVATTTLVNGSWVDGESFPPLAAYQRPEMGLTA